MSYTMIEGNRRHMSGPNGTVTRIVIHATCSSTARGGARGNARYFQSDSAGGLAHFVVDPGEIIQCCKEDTACWHAPPNRGSLGVELCDWQKGAGARWADADHEQMLQHAAALVADLCHRHGIPVRKLSPADLKANPRVLGVCGHHDVTEAFGQSSHADPDVAGPFPWDRFLQMVTANLRPPAHDHPTPAPAPHPAPLEARMLVQFHGEPAVYEVVGSRLQHVTQQAWRARGLKQAQVTQLPTTHPLYQLPKDAS